MLLEIIKKSIKSTENKVGLNFKLPLSKKEIFEKLCHKYNISMTDMLLSIIDYIIDEDAGLIHNFNTESLLDLNKQIKLLDTKIDTYYDYSDKQPIPIAVKNQDWLKLKELYELENERNRLVLIFKYVEYELKKGK